MTLFIFEALEYRNNSWIFQDIIDFGVPTIYWSFVIKYSSSSLFLKQHLNNLKGNKDIFKKNYNCTFI